MSNDKIESLEKYISQHKARLTSPVPDKHKGHPESYKSYLSLEIKKASQKLEKLKEAAPAKK